MSKSSVSNVIRFIPPGGSFGSLSARVESIRSTRRRATAAVTIFSSALSTEKPVYVITYSDRDSPKPLMATIKLMRMTKLIDSSPRSGELKFASRRIKPIYLHQPPLRGMNTSAVFGLLTNLSWVLAMVCLGLGFFYILTVKSKEKS